MTYFVAITRTTCAYVFGVAGSFGKLTKHVSTRGTYRGTSCNIVTVILHFQWTFASFTNLAIDFLFKCYFNTEIKNILADGIYKNPPHTNFFRSLWRSVRQNFRQSVSKLRKTRKNGV